MNLLVAEEAAVLKALATSLASLRAPASWPILTSAAPIEITIFAPHGAGEDCSPESQLINGLFRHVYSNVFPFRPAEGASMLDRDKS